MPQLISSPGGFRFLPADGPFSEGVVADEGHTIVRVRAPRTTSLSDGYLLVERTLRAGDRPLASLCAMELRIPAPLTRPGFEAFNREYVAQMQRWGVVIDGHLPAARTNVAPELDPPSGPCLHAFCFATPAPGSGKTFVVSGVPERLGTSGGPGGYWNDIVTTVERRMAALGVAWADVTETQLYAPAADHTVFAAASLARLRELARPGIRWFLSRPPIDDLRMEIDVRALAEDRTA